MFILYLLKRMVMGVGMVCLLPFALALLPVFGVLIWIGEIHREYEAEKAKKEKKRAA